MKIYCCYTPSHNRLYEKYFLPSLPKSFQCHATRLDITGRGDFQSEEFIRTLEAKLELVLESLEANRGDVILWSDVDIVYFGNVEQALAAVQADESIDMWFQKERRRKSDTEVNAGLILMRCNSAVAQLYRDALAVMRSTPGFNDQEAINQLLRKGVGVNWTYLPLTFTARSQGWPPNADIVAYHANWTVGEDGVGQKVRQFADLKWYRRLGKRYWPYRQKLLRFLDGLKLRSPFSRRP